MKGVADSFEKLSKVDFDQLYKKLLQAESYKKQAQALKRENAGLRQQLEDSTPDIQEEHLQKLRERIKVLEEENHDLKFRLDGIYRELNG